jgi:MFS family permease
MTPPTVSPDHERGIPSRYRHKLPFRRIFTYNVVCTLIANALLTFGNGTFNNVFFTFQSTPVYDQETISLNYTPHPLLKFTGGLGLPPRDIGFATAVLGAVGIVLQIFFYPIVNAHLGTVHTWKICLYCFPIVYLITPFLALVPSTLPPPSPKSGMLAWVCICGVLFVQLTARTFATPAAAILIHNCSPHPSILGTVHGMGQSASSAARTIGPALGGWMYGIGLNHGVVGAVFWGLAGMAVVTIVVSSWVSEGDGHEIRLESDEEPGR